MRGFSTPSTSSRATSCDSASIECTDASTTSCPLAASACADEAASDASTVLRKMFFACSANAPTDAVTCVTWSRCDWMLSFDSSVIRLVCSAAARITMPATDAPPV